MTTPHCYGILQKTLWNFVNMSQAFMNMSWTFANISWMLVYALCCKPRYTWWIAVYIRTYYLRSLKQFTNGACFDTVCEAGSLPLFVNYAWIYLANLFINRLQTRTLVHISSWAMQLTRFMKLLLMNYSCLTV